MKRNNEGSKISDKTIQKSKESPYVSNEISKE